MDIIEELIRIYETEEQWHKTKLSREEARKYFQTVLKKGRILWYMDRGNLVAYVESWRVNYEQLGRIICKAPFSAYLEDVETGAIAYLANTWIHKDYRRTNVYRLMRDIFMEQNRDCEYYVGDARRKRTGLIKVFKGGKYGNRTQNNTATSYATSNRA